MRRLLFSVTCFTMYFLLAATGIFLVTQTVLALVQQVQGVTMWWLIAPVVT